VEEELFWKLSCEYETRGKISMTRKKKPMLYEKGTRDGESEKGINEAQRGGTTLYRAGFRKNKGAKKKRVF